MDRFEVKCVAQQKWDVFFGTEIGQPVPVEGRFAAHDQVLVSKRQEGREKDSRLLGVEILVEMFFPVLVDNTNMHAVGVEVNSTVELVLSLIKSHHVLPWASVLEP